MSKECPKCGLANPLEAQRCDCGYDFETKSGGTDVKAGLRWLRILATTAIILVTNFIGLAATFSDLGRGESMTHRFLPVAVVYAIAGIAIGVQFEKQWYITAGILFLGELTSVETSTAVSHELGHSLKSFCNSSCS
jgi:hypothetical protein